MGTSSADFSKFQQFTKVEESKDGSVVVWGIATEQKPDLDNEVCSYEDAVPVYKKWSDDAAKRTKKAGQELSLGPVRLQHSLDIGGKATKLEFDDDEKAIYLGSVPLNEQIKADLRSGFYTGYSQGGSYAWRKCTECGKSLGLAQASNWCSDCKKNVTVLYGLKRLAEVSYVDSPCSGVGFEYVKSNGSREIIKFAKRGDADMPELTQAHVQQIANAVKDALNKKEATTKRIAGVDLTADCFAYVGDADKTATWKLPIKFPDDEAKTKRHIRNALARFDSTKGIPEDKKAAVKAKIVAAAKKHCIEVTDEETKAAKAELQTHAVAIFKAAVEKAPGADKLEKNLWDVGELARVMQTLAFLYENALFERDFEQDDSEIPEELKDILDNLVETFIRSAEEEARELAARTDKVTKLNKGGSMTPEEQAAADKAAKEAAQAAELVKKKGLAHHFTKTAHHHEKMADHHEKMAASHDKMHEACKADVGNDEPGAHVAEAPYYKAAGAHHKAMAAHHEKCHKCHMAAAEHNHGMAESHDPEEHAKVSKALKEADAAADPTPAPVVKTAPSLDGDVAAELDKARKSPEYQKAIEDIAKAKLEEELQTLREKTLAPDGVKLSGANGGVAAAPGVRAVPRTEPTEEFKFAASGAGVSSTGL